MPHLTAEDLRRVNANGSFLFLLNHNSGPVEVALPRRSHDLLTGTPHAGTVVLELYGVLILKDDTPE